MSDPTVEPGASASNRQDHQSTESARSANAESTPTASSEPARTVAQSGPEGSGGASASEGEASPSGDSVNRPRRRRGSRGGRNRNRSGGAQNNSGNASSTETASADDPVAPKPQIGDSRPAPESDEADPSLKDEGQASGQPRSGNRRRRGGRGRGGGGGGQQQGQNAEKAQNAQQGQQTQNVQPNQQKGQQRKGVAPKPVEAILGGDGPDLDEETLEKRKGRERNGRPVGRYMMAVSVRPEATQIAVLEGRNLIEHYVSRPADDVAQIHGNIYLGKVQNVLPGMEAAFVDIATPKNAVLYRGDVQFDADDVEGAAANARIEQILKPRQTIICQVTKNPIAHKGARLTQEVSLPGRFVVLIPNSSTYGISKRLDDGERRRLRNILDKVKPPQHGVIVRTAAEGVTSEEISSDVRRLLSQWEQIENLANTAQAPALLYREPDMAVRVIREEFSDNYRSVVIDDEALYKDVHDYVSSISPALADRIEFYDRSTEPLSIFERHHVHEQVHKALDRKVWLPSGGSLIIEHTEALTVIDVNTGKNVGSKSLEETVYRNNLEAAVEIAKQLRLRDIGGIIVIDFIDMEIKGNRDDVVKVFREALARDKTRTQVFDISELGLVEMTRKRIGEGLLESFATQCPDCEGRGVQVDPDLLV